MRFAIGYLALSVAACCFAEEPSAQLPRPAFHIEPSDPAWFGPAVQLHGHLGPWLVAGVRMGAAGRRAVGAKGYFDVEVAVEGPLSLPPQACFLDGIQIATGATLGKRNLKWVEAPQVAVKIKNVRTGKTAVVRPTQNMLKQIAAAKGSPMSPANPDRVTAHRADDPDDIDAVARRLAKSEEAGILLISRD